MSDVHKRRLTIDDSLQLMTCKALPETEGARMRMLCLWIEHSFGELRLALSQSDDLKGAEKRWLGELIDRRIRYEKHLVYRKQGLWLQFPQTPK